MFDIYVDSGANLPSEIVSKYGIKVITFINYVNGKAIPGFEPGLSLEEERAKGKEYYDNIRAGAEVKTSLINAGQFADEFRASLDQGRDVLCFTISHGISGTFNAAKIAQEDLNEEYPDRRVYLVDSLNASLAEGILAIYAYELNEKGIALDKIAEVLQDAAHGMNGVFTVDDLKYLARTGRLSNGTALIGNMLNIKPILKGSKEGVIVQFKKCRGRKKALATLIDLVCDNIVEPEKQIIGIAHADCYEESLYVMEKIQERVHVREFINTSYDFCTGSHVGPETIALFFIAADRELEGKPADGTCPTREILNLL